MGVTLRTKVYARRGDETSLYYDEDYEDFINTQREAFKKGYLSAIQELNLN